MKNSISTNVEYFVINRMFTESSRLESVFYVLEKYFGRLPEATELSEDERFWSKHSSEGFWGTENNFKGSKGLPSLRSDLHSS